MSICACVCVHSRVLQTLRTAPPENTGRALQTQRTSSIHRLATELRNGEEMGRTEWVGSKLSAFRGEDAIFIYSIRSGTPEGVVVVVVRGGAGQGGAAVEWGCTSFAKGHPRWSALTCTNPLYPVSFSHPSHLSCTQSSRDLPGN